MLVSCTRKSSKEERFLSYVKTDVATLKRQLPHSFIQKHVMLVDLNLKDTVLVFDFDVSDELWNQIPIVDETASQEINYGRSLGMLSKFALAKFMQANIAMQFCYSKAGTRVGEVLVPAAQTKEISRKVENAEILPFRAIEVFALDCYACRYPLDLGNGFWCTKGYVEGNNVYYQYSVDENIDKSRITSKMKSEIKQDLITDFSKNELVKEQKDHVIADGICFNFAYTNNKGQLLFTISITPDELF